MNDPPSERDHVSPPELSEIENSAGINQNELSKPLFAGEQSVSGPAWAHPLILTSVFFGTQGVWSTEMAYASPFLHGLGLSKAVTALVFLAAPISGLIVQPLIGAVADRSTSRFGRRRPIMLIGSVLCGLSMIALSWSADISDAIGGSHGLGIGIAVISFYGIDFTVNAVTACDRALVVDLLPSDKQEKANLWVSRTTSLGALLGFFIGHLNLQYIPGIRLLGDSQLQDLSALVAIGLVFWHLLVSLCIQERQLLPRNNTGRTTNRSPRHLVQQILYYIRVYTVELPRRIKMIGTILFLSWIGWFPFMFFGSLWLGDIYRRQHTFPGDKSSERERAERATQAAAQSMMYYALVSFLTSIFLPFLVDQQRKVKVAIGSEHLVFMWAFSQVVFAICLFSTIWTHTYEMASSIYAISGFSSAMLHWAPHALLGEAILDEHEPLLKNGDHGSRIMPETSPLLASPANVNGQLSTSTINPQTLSPTLTDRIESDIKNSSGAILGIANVAVVLPQFLIIALSAIVFAIFEPNRSVIPHSNQPEDMRHFDSITIIFGIGGLSTLVGAYLTYKLGNEGR